MREAGQGNSQIQVMSAADPLPPLNRSHALANPPAAFVWPGGRSEGKMEYAYFRNHFELTSVPGTAQLHLFADANYHLRVNGQFVGYGPCRFYPEYPEFDSYDLAPFLKPGPNIVAVWVWNPGSPNFHRLYNPGGFVAWGEVEADGQPIDLATPGHWQSSVASGFDATAPKFSFAQGPIQIFDEREGIADWDQLPDGTDNWQAPQPVDQAPWGPLAPRRIAYLDHQERGPSELLSVHNHLCNRQIISFQLGNVPDPKAYYANRAFALAYTFIHSPREQTVTAYSKWGENYLNGQFVERQPVDDLFFADALEFPLKEGWNFFFLKRALFEWRWDFALSLPRDAELVISADRQLEPREKNPAFYTAGPFDPQDAQIQQLDPSTIEPDSIGTYAQPWMPRAGQPECSLPAMHLAWAEFGPGLIEARDQLENFTVPAGTATSYVFDMGGIVLGMPFVEFDAPAGTIIDTGYSEDLKNDRPWLFKNIQVPAADRHIAAGGPSRMQVFAPRGFRYLQLTIHGHDSPVTIGRLGIITATYPHRLLGEFQCSDPGYNELYAMGWRTLVACSEDVYTDCPWRERTLYAGDMLPEFATAYVTSGDTQLIKRCIDIFLQSQSEKTGWQISMAPMSREREKTLVDYALTCLIALVWHHRLTGDRAFAEYAYPRFRFLMERAMEYRHANGLFALFAKPFIEHGPLGRDEDFNTALNALFVGAFESIAYLARLFENDEAAARYESIAESTALAVESRMWNPELDAFSDGLIDDDLTSESHGVTNGYCSFFGATSPDREQAIMHHYESLLAKVTRENPEALVSSYGAFFLLGGLYRQNHTLLAEQVIRRCYRFMLDDKSDTVWEHFDNGKSLCHAWSTAPNFYFATCTLGVKLGLPESETSLEKILVQPQSETLDWARGAVPHPKGLVRVEWQVNGSRLEIQIEKPSSTVEVICQPVGRLAALELHLTVDTAA